jgi:glucosamine--fructose-6-phosphate aminotransferase (isomerizing)
MSGYHSDILAQPDALRSTLATLGETTIPAEIVERFREGHDLPEGRRRKVVLTGMGSSYFALLPLYHRLLAEGCPAWLVETSELLYSPAFLEPDALIIAASQSGASGETVHMLEKITPEMTVIGLTNTIDSPLDRGSTYSLVTRAGSEATVSCKTYVTALAAQCWLGDQLCAGPREFPGLADLPDTVEAYLSHTAEHIDRLTGLLEGIRQVYLAGRGISIASVGTGGLILKESVHIAAEGMSSASFRHGPIEMVGPETFILIFAGQGETVSLNRNLYQDITRLGGRAALLDTRAGAGVFDLPPCPPQALPVLEILPVQMMTLALARLRHMTPGSFTVASKVTATE